MAQKKRILVAPLNWGLGHAARCIPLVNALLAQGAEVFLASDGGADRLLKKEFPQLTTLTLPAYDIHYQTENMFLNMGLQVGKIAWAAYQEHRLLQKIIQDYKIDVVISDNRFGCFTKSKEVLSIFMTHQINILTPYAWLQTPVRWLNHWFIRRFAACWIPDIEDESTSLSGALAHGNEQSLPNIRYLGVLSRMKKKVLPLEYDLIAVLSGPEPQRTILEENIIFQLKNSAFQDLKCLIIQGLTQEKKHFFIEKNIEVVSYMTTQELNDAIAKSHVVLSRSGYTTLMDLAVLGKKAILIPTPGQTEQEYLAQRFWKKKIFFTQTQKEFSLEKSMLSLSNYEGIQSDNYDNSAILEKVIQELLAKI